MLELQSGRVSGVSSSSGVVLEFQIGRVASSSGVVLELQSGRFSGVSEY